MKPQTLSSEIVHQNPWYHIQKDELIWPDGKPGQYFIIKGPLACIILAIEGDKILVEKQYRYPVQEDSIEFPTGRIEPGEEKSVAARRELEEETGYHADHLKEIGKFNVYNGIADHLVHVFLATDLTKTQTHLESSESGLMAFWITIDEWKKLIREGQIHDGESLSAWTIYQAQKDS